MQALKKHKDSILTIMLIMCVFYNFGDSLFAKVHVDIMGVPLFIGEAALCVSGLLTLLTLF